MRITLLNTHSSLNIGDASIVQAQIRILRELYPGARITLSSRTPALDRKAYKALDVRILPPLVPAPSLYSGSGSKFRESLKGLAAFGDRRALLAEIRESHIVLASGGGYFWCHRRLLPGPMFLQNLLPLRYACRYKKPVVFLPQSIGPVMNRLAGRLLAAVLRHQSVRRIFVREQSSADTVYRLLTDGEARAKVEVCPDVAFLLAEKENGPAGAGIPGLPPFPRPLMVLTLRTWDFPETGDRRSRRTAQEDFLAEIEKVCREVVLGNGGSVLLYAHVRGPGKFEDDRPLSQSFYRRLKAALPPSRLAWMDLPEGAGPSEVLSLLSRADLLLATRFHSALLGLVAGLPVVVVNYQPKSRGTFRLLGLEENSFDIGEVRARDILERISSLLRCGREFRRRLEDRMEKARSEIREKLSRTLTSTASPRSSP